MAGLARSIDNPRPARSTWGAASPRACLANSWKRTARNGCDHGAVDLGDHVRARPHKGPLYPRMPHTAADAKQRESRGYWSANWSCRHA
jgi:hypothetical protein